MANKFRQEDFIPESSKDKTLQATTNKEEEIQEHIDKISAIIGHDRVTYSGSDKDILDNLYDHIRAANLS